MGSLYLGKVQPGLISELLIYWWWEIDNLQVPSAFDASWLKNITNVGQPCHKAHNDALKDMSLNETPVLLVSAICGSCLHLFCSTPCRAAQ